MLWNILFTCRKIVLFVPYGIMDVPPRADIMRLCKTNFELIEERKNRVIKITKQWRQDTIFLGQKSFNLYKSTPRNTSITIESSVTNVNDWNMNINEFIIGKRVYRHTCAIKFLNINNTHYIDFKKVIFAVAVFKNRYEKDIVLRFSDCLRTLRSNGRWHTSAKDWSSYK